MSIESWDPNASQRDNSSTLDQAFIDRCLNHANMNELDTLATVLSEQDKNAYPCIDVDPQQWLELLEQYDNQKLVMLIRFFAAIEAQLNEWQAGAKSPAITIYRLLKSRGEKLDKSELLWLRQHSTNRYIPYGNVL